MLMTLGLIGGTKEWLLDKIGFKFAILSKSTFLLNILPVKMVVQ